MNGKACRLTTHTKRVERKESKALLLRRPRQLKQYEMIMKREKRNMDELMKAVDRVVIRRMLRARWK